MRSLKVLLLGGIAAGSIAIANAAVLVPVAPVQNSVSTSVFGINDSNIVAGSYTDAGGAEHAFFGTIDGSYTTFDAGSGGTEARGINNAGYIAGFSNSQSGSTADQTMFIRKPNGSLQTVPGFMGRAQGINDSNRFAGTYWDFADFEAVAFVGRNAKYKHDVKLPVVHQASDGESINNKGDVAGYIFQPPTHGFIASGKTLTLIDYPSDASSGTTLEGINDEGQAAGQWLDADGNAHAFLLDIPAGTFTDIEVKGAKNVAAWGLNNAGAVAVTTDIGPFIWCKKARYCPSGGAPVDAPAHAAAKPFRRLLLR